MADNWVETYRGSVAPWECDVTEHFTIAYYFDRLDQAEANLADELGLGDVLRRGGFARSFAARFAREMRAGTACHIESAAIGLDDGVRLGHRFVDSMTGEIVTWIDERWDAAAPVAEARREAIAARLAEWSGPAAEDRAEPRDTAGFRTSARGRVRPSDFGENGRFGLASFVHKFTDSSVQTGAAIGLTADYIKTARRGFSTFELALRVRAEPRSGEPYLVETAILHLGKSSIRFLHVMTNPETGEELARLGQFGVQLDLDARRPAALADDLRARAAKLVVPAN
jgi:acyl-CoA thioesterase FadM